MKVFLSHSHEDQAIAASISEALFEHSIQTSTFADVSVGADIRKEISRQIERADATVVILSERSTRSEWIRHELDVAIQGWSKNRLFLVRVDSAETPIGLRDLNSLGFSTSATGSRESERIAIQISRSLRHGPVKPQFLPAPPASAREEHAFYIRHSPLLPFIGFIYALAFIFATVTLLGLVTVPDFYQKLSELPDFVALIVGEDARETLSRIVLIVLPPSLYLVGIIISSIYSGARYSGARQRTVSAGSADEEDHALSSAEARELSREAAQGAGGTHRGHDIFTSYSSKNMDKVSDIVHSIRSYGLLVWIDTERQTATQRYAANIARAIRQSKLVVVVGSTSAFDSDHVVREVYLAGDMKKDFAVILVEEIEIPDELNYFFTGFPRLHLSQDPTLNVGRAVRDLIA